MKKFLSLFIALLGTTLLNAQIPNYNFALRAGGADNDNSRDHVIDAVGNIYAIEYFYNSPVIDLDPSAATFTISGAANSGRSALVKYSPNGQFIWGIKLGSGGEIGAEALAMDAAGNFYISGEFTGTVDFDPGAASFPLVESPGTGDIFVQKLDPNGAFLWAFSYSSSGFDRAMDIQVSAAGNVYLCGMLEGSNIDMDPGSANVPFSPSGQNDAFLAKYNSSGQYQWAFITGDIYADNWEKMILDASENIYVMGGFMGTVDVNPGSASNMLTASTTQFDLFIGKYNASGQYQWAFKIASPNDDASCGFAFDQSGNIFAACVTNGTAVDFDPGAGTTNLNTLGGAACVGKYSPSGSFLGAMRILSTQGAAPYADAAGNLYLAGSFNMSTDFDPGAGTVTLNTNGNTDIFVAKYSSSFVYQWAFPIGGADYDQVSSITVDNFDNVTITGSFGSSSMDCNPSATVSTVTNAGSVGYSDIVIARYSQHPDVGVKEISAGSEFVLAPNPNNGQFSIHNNSGEAYGISIYNSIGQLVLNVTNVVTEQHIDLRSFEKGIYSVVMNSKGNFKASKVVVD